MQGRTHCIACGTALVLNGVQESPAMNPVSATIESEVLPGNISPAGETISSAQSPELTPVSSPVFPEQEASPSVEELKPVEDSIVVPSQAPDRGVAVEPSWLDPSSSAQENPVREELVDHTVPNQMSQAPIQPTVGESAPRVNVQYDADELAEVPMPIHHESKVEQVAPDASPSTMTNESEELEEHTGPWLALTVLGIVLIVVILLIYFIYNWLTGSGASNGVQPTLTPTPTIVQTTLPTVTPTPISQLSSDDAQRERDINDLKVALSAYYQAKQRYPGAATYNGLLNALIGGGYLSRRVQDPAFPATEYAYSVDSTGQSYDITVTFDSIVSSLLAGATSPVYKLRGAAGN